MSRKLAGVGLLIRLSCAGTGPPDCRYVTLARRMSGVGLGARTTRGPYSNEAVDGRGESNASRTGGLRGSTAVAQIRRTPGHRCERRRPEVPVQSSPA
jgi:hypothetical protein